MKIKQLSTKAEIIRTILSKAEEPIYLAFILLILALIKKYSLTYSEIP